jgi:CheY-like chemotaxis protein
MTSTQAFRILIVDDLADNVFLLQTVLEAEGYEVETALGGYAALEKLQATSPDLILLDVMMPDLDGYEVTRRIRRSQQFANLPIFLISAYDQADTERGQAIGATDFLRKPIDFDRLLTLVRYYLIDGSSA